MGGPITYGIGVQPVVSSLSLFKVNSAATLSPLPYYPLLPPRSLPQNAGLRPKTGRIRLLCLLFSPQSTPNHPETTPKSARVAQFPLTSCIEVCYSMSMQNPERWPHERSLVSLRGCVCSSADELQRKAPLFCTKPAKVLGIRPLFGRYLVDFR